MLSPTPETSPAPAPGSLQHIPWEALAEHGYQDRENDGDQDAGGTLGWPRERQRRSGQFEADLVAELATLRTRATFLERSSTAAGDLVQDTLERALSNWFRFQAGTDMRRWLLAIMQNLFVDRCRKRKRSRESIAPDIIAADRATPVEEASELHRVPDAMALVGRLTRPLQETVRLVLLDGRSYREAAAQLGVPTPTVGTRMARARAKLRAFARSGGHADP
jgi:RNA polymerase sigma-70 factor, ECF subfamily